jgi:hypothetical protein
MTSILLEIVFLSFEILCFGIHNFVFSPSFSTFSMSFSFLEDLIYQFRRFPMFKEKNWLPC